MGQASLAHSGFDWHFQTAPHDDSILNHSHDGESVATYPEITQKGSLHVHHGELNLRYFTHAARSEHVFAIPVARLRRGHQSAQ